MLILRRREGEGVRIGPAVVRVGQIGKSTVKLAIDAPQPCQILRLELDERDEPSVAEAGWPEDLRFYAEQAAKQAGMSLREWIIRACVRTLTEDAAEPQE